MAGYQRAVAVDPGPVGDAAEPQYKPAFHGQGGQIELGFVPEIPGVVPLLVGGEQVGEAGGNRHGDGSGQPGFGPAGLVALGGGVKLEFPQAVQQRSAAASVADRVQERFGYHKKPPQNDVFSRSVP